MDLHHGFPAGHRIVMHVGIEIGETASRESSHLAFVKVVPIPTLNVPEMTVTFSR